MAVSGEFRDFVEDQLSGFGPVTVRPMFGGAGIFHDGLMFGLIADETLYLKVDDTNRDAFEAEGSEPMLYVKNGKSMAMSYWRLPERLYEDPDEMTSWARAAFAVAVKAKKPKSRR
ncbi:MAG: TfoX/Sxy family protein [Hyphomicrobiales bacterium]